MSSAPDGCASQRLLASKNKRGRPKAAPQIRFLRNRHLPAADAAATPVSAPAYPARAAKRTIAVARGLGHDRGGVLKLRVQARGARRLRLRAGGQRGNAQGERGGRQRQSKFFHEYPP